MNIKINNIKKKSNLFFKWKDNDPTKDMLDKK